MIMGRVEPDDPIGEAEKPLNMPMPASGFTLNFKFYEMPMAVVGSDQQYQVYLSDAAGLVTGGVLLGGDGVLAVELGATLRMLGSWTPLGSSAPHVVHLTYDGTTPLLWIDGVPVALAPILPLGFTRSPSTMTAEIGKQGDPVPPGDGMGSFDWIFATTGILPPTTSFCCPGGSPP
jgi:hypothetical protein